MKTPASIILQVNALRTAAEAARLSAVTMIELAEALLYRFDEDEAASTAPVVTPDPPEFPSVDGCTHPEDKRQDTTTNGPRSFFCPGCRRTSDELHALKGAA